MSDKKEITINTDDDMVILILLAIILTFIALCVACCTVEDGIKAFKPIIVTQPESSHAPEK